MYPGNFFIPRSNLINAIYPTNNLMHINPFFRGINSGNGINIFNKIATGIKKFNWGNLINGANKTLNVMNKTIPLIKEAKPMVNNLRSIVQLTRAFNHETTNSYRVSSNKEKKYSVRDSKNAAKETNVSQDNNQPTFFI